MVTRLAAAATAAAVLLSGCGHTTETAAETAADAGWVTADQIPPPGTAIAPPSWRGELHPSSGIVSGGLTCTAGWILPGPDGVPVMLTARHCDPQRGDGVVSAPSGIGDVGVWVEDSGAMTDRIGDVAAVRLSLIDPAKVDGGGISGVMPAAEVGKLPPHTPACAWLPSGSTICGEISGAGDASAFLEGFAPATIRDGDSGSPVWTLNRDGKVVAIGVLSSTLTDDLAKVAYIEPVVRANQLKLPQS